MVLKKKKYLLLKGNELLTSGNIIQEKHKVGCVKTASGEI